MKNARKTTGGTHGRTTLIRAVNLLVPLPSTVQADLNTLAVLLDMDIVLATPASGHPHEVTHTTIAPINEDPTLSQEEFPYRRLNAENNMTNNRIPSYQIHARLNPMNYHQMPFAQENSAP